MRTDVDFGVFFALRGVGSETIQRQSGGALRFYGRGQCIGQWDRCYGS